MLHHHHPYMHKVKQQFWVPRVGHKLDLETATVQVIEDKLRTRGTFVHDSA